MVGLIPTPIADPNSFFGAPAINISPLAGMDIYTTAGGANIGVVANGNMLYCVGNQNPPQPGAPVSYDLNTVKQGRIGRIVFTQAGMKSLDGVVDLIDVAVAPF